MTICRVAQHKHSSGVRSGNVSWTETECSCSSRRLFITSEVHRRKQEETWGILCSQQVLVQTQKKTETLTAWSHQRYLLKCSDLCAGNACFIHAHFLIVFILQPENAEKRKQKGQYVPVDQIPPFQSAPSVQIY